MSARRWLPALAWAAVILVLTSVPVPAVAAPSGSDKLVHAAVYAVLGFLVARALEERPSRRALALSAIIGAAYGAVDEWHQRFIPGRSASHLDWIADAVGAAVGSSLAVAWSNRTVE